MYHFEITYYIYQSFLDPYYCQLFMNKQENQTYSKPEKYVKIGYSWTKDEKIQHDIYIFVILFIKEKDEKS